MAAIQQASREEQPADHLRQALAIAIVQQKRRQSHELDQLRAKLSRIESHLQQEQHTSAELRNAANHLAAANAAAQRTLPNERQQVQQYGSIGANQLQHWLPPLESSSSAGAASTESLVDLDFAALAHNITAASKHGLSSAAQDVLCGKAQTLSSMLLANIRLLHVLRPSAQEPGAACTAPASSHSSSPAAEVAEFVTGTLLHTPVTTLSHAYMQQSAAVLAAACVSSPAGGGNQHASSSMRRDLSSSGTCDSAVHAVGVLMEQLLESAIPTQQTNQQELPSAPAAAQQVHSALRALAALPPTGALLLRGCALHLQRACQALSDARAAMQQHAAGACGQRSCMGTMEVDGGDAGQEHAAWGALVHGAALFEASHELVELFGVSR